MIKILITGSNGLLGQKLSGLILETKNIKLIATSKGENKQAIKKGYTYAAMDITQALEVANIINYYKPDVVINTAAITNVDTCHTNHELCWDVNVNAVTNLIDACRKTKSKLIHISTDFIFDGLDGPYLETAIPNPISYYGKSKWAAEQLIIQSDIKWAILRTILVYGVVKNLSRSNIVLWAKNALQKGETIKVVNDQWRTPTLAEDLATICILAAQKNVQGIYNASGKDRLSILELVQAVADFYSLDKSLIIPISSASLNQAAKRPAKTGFILDKAVADLGYSPHSFIDGLKIMDKQLHLLNDNV